MFFPCLKNIILLGALGLTPGLPRFVQACAKANCTFSAQILADSNRDGVINHLDSHDKNIWNTSRGAIFLPNIGDRGFRCSTTDLNGRSLSNVELAACNDASGDTLLDPTMAAPIRTLPLPDLSDHAVGSIYIEPASAIDRVRIFWSQTWSSSDPIHWATVNRQVSFNATSLRQGIRLAIDGRELVTDASIWDGAATVKFEVTDRNCTSGDYVALKQAPVLLHHHLQQANTVLVTRNNSISPWQAKFVLSLQEKLASLAKQPRLDLLNRSDDIWAQDFLEPGYANMPGPNGTVSIRIMLRSAQSTRDAGRQVFEQLRGPGIGGYQPSLGSGFGLEEINSGGNIETIPPYVSRSGIRYPNGRILTAKQFDKQPAESALTFFESQNAQPVLLLESGWLAIGHVDEMVQFLPSDNGLGFTIGFADTTAAFDILRTTQAAGYGSTTVLSYSGDMTPDPETIVLDPTLRNLTIDALLADEDFLETNRYAQGFMDQNLELLLNDIPLSEADIVRVPVLWKDITYAWPATPDGHPSRLRVASPGQRQVKAFFPEALNGLLLGHDYLAPKPFGPVVEGHDIFERAIVDVYGRLGIKTHFVDDYMSHHVRGGEVHCATNSLRDTSTPWVPIQ
ncbi:peptidylarginine deiminase [Paramyrothecium foliicola]|nr:peptidylarginine deiminase [Paramyrothecium foliicola]